MEFVERALHNNHDIVGVLFIMTIDSSKISASTTPFALITEYTAFKQEQEILFSMHAVFRVDEIKLVVNSNHLWEVQLTLKDANDVQLAGLMNRLGEELRVSTGWHRLGDLMLKVGNFNEAEEFYNELLKGSTSDRDTAYIYHQLGRVKRQQG